MLCYYFSLQNICIFFRWKHLELKLIPFFYPLYKLINLLSYESVDVCIDSDSRNIQLFFFIYWWKYAPKITARTSEIMEAVKIKCRWRNWTLLSLKEVKYSPKVEGGACGPLRSVFLHSTFTRFTALLRGSHNWNKISIKINL